MSCDFLKRCGEMLGELQPGLSEVDKAAFVQKLRSEFAGERIYIPKLNIDHEGIRLAFTGDNFDQLETMFGASASTIRRDVNRRKSD